MVQERRRCARNAVLKRGRLVAADGVHDCVVLDSSDRGARVRTGSPTVLPTRMELHLQNGAVFAAASRWARGTEIGLEFSPDEAGLDPVAAERAWSAYEMLRDGRLDEALRLVKAEGCFDDEAMRLAAIEAEAACARLEAALRKRGRRRTS